MTYTAKEGQTWDMVSHEVYGDERYVQELLTENPKLRNTVIFDGGERIAVPELVQEDGGIWS